MHLLIEHAWRVSQTKAIAAGRLAVAGHLCLGAEGSYM